MFGYVCFFSVSCPLTPLIVFLLICTEKTVDTLKFFYLVRVDRLFGSKGIGIYNKIFTVLYFGGMIFSICSVVFMRYYLIEHLQLFVKISVLFTFETVLLLSLYFYNWNILPEWFENRDIINDKFVQLYYYKGIL